MSKRKEITELLKSTNRVGMNRMISWLINNGFFTCPASTKFHGCYEGGLADHSMALYSLLECKQHSLKLDTVRSPGQKPFEIKPEHIIIAALLHDICKVGAYIGTAKPYKWNKGQPKGHAILSIERISEFIKLEPIEEMMIRYHMGPYGLNEFYKEGDWQSGEYPLRGDHIACEGMSKEESQTARYGKSLANAWFHNPICKLMYFCDELATLQEKTKE